MQASNTISVLAPATPSGTAQVGTQMTLASTLSTSGASASYNKKEQNKKTQGSRIAGGNPLEGRAEKDFYATDPKALEMLMEVYELKGSEYLDPCVGQGNLANVLTNKGYHVDGIDIVDRGWKGTQVGSFLGWQTTKIYDGIVMNPPFSYAKEFVEESFKHVKDGGQIVMFERFQFLESQDRKELLDKYPLKYVYIFRKRIACWKHGKKQKGGSTQCFCWFIWEKGCKTEPIIRWLDR